MIVIETMNGIELCSYPEVKIAEPFFSKSKCKCEHNYSLTLKRAMPNLARESCKVLGDILL